MKRLLIKILICILAIATCLGLVSCKKSEWEGTSMKSWGASVSSGGFIAETQNYLYYINGFASYGEENDFGVPVKGALMAVEKSSIKSGNLKTEVVVPKLFVANDYEAGVFIYGNYVYYGTPSTDKTNSGEIARSQMTFTRTKLDGTDTKTFFTVSSHSFEYRFVESNGVVFLIYYDTDNSKLVCYNTNTGKEDIIAKAEYTTKGKFESLDKYELVDASKLDGVVVFYTATVYAEDYYSEAASQSGYNRKTALYNKMYAYKVGDTVQDGNEFMGTVIKDGKDEDLKFTIKSVEYGEGTNYLIFEEKDITNDVTCYAVDFTKLNDQSAYTKIVNTSYLEEDILFVDLDEIYYPFIDQANDDPNAEESDTSSSIIFVIKTTLVEKDTEKRIKVGKFNFVPTLFEKRVENGKDYLYFFNGSNNLSRIEVVNVNDAQTELNSEQRISEGSVASSWYKPEFITIDQDEYVFYCDNSPKGASYVKYVKLTGAEVKSEEAEDGTIIYYIQGHKSMGKITAFDKASIAKSDLNAITTLTWDKEESKLIGEQEILDARASYNALSSQAKEEYGEESLAKLQNAEKALTLAKTLYKLDGIIYYDEETTPKEQRDAYKQAYDSIKADMLAVKDDTAILDLLENNMKYNFYEKATAIFG